MVKKRFKKSIFFPPKYKALAKKISIKSPSAFRESIKKVAKGGITLREFRALNLAKTRAKVQLKRKTLSSKERKEFGIIAKIKIPKVTMREKIKYVRADKNLAGKLAKYIIVSDDLVRRGLKIKRKKKGHWFLKKGKLYVNPKIYFKQKK